MRDLSVANLALSEDLVKCAANSVMFDKLNQQLSIVLIMLTIAQKVEGEWLDIQRTARSTPIKQATEGF